MNVTCSGTQTFEMNTVFINRLRVNIKTQIMVFARSKTKLRNLPISKFGNFDLELVQIIFIWFFVLIGMAHL